MGLNKRKKNQISDNGLSDKQWESYNSMWEKVEGTSRNYKKSAANVRPVSQPKQRKKGDPITDIFMILSPFLVLPALGLILGRYDGEYISTLIPAIIELLLLIRTGLNSVKRNDDTFLNSLALVFTGVGTLFYLNWKKIPVLVHFMNQVYDSGILQIIAHRFL